MQLSKHHDRIADVVVCSRQLDVRQSFPVYARACFFGSHELLVGDPPLASYASAEEAGGLDGVGEGGLDGEGGWGLGDPGFDRILEAFDCSLLEDVAGEEEEDCECYDWTDQMLVGKVERCCARFRTDGGGYGH